MFSKISPVAFKDKAQLNLIRIEFVALLATGILFELALSVIAYLSFL